MSALVPINNAQAPALARQRMQDQAVAKQLQSNFSEGVVDSYPVISIKGKIFRFKFQGEETAHVDANRYPIPYLDLVLVNGSPDISKVYYEKGFTEGDMAPPDCWSMNGIKPDPSSPKLQSPTCKGCKQNVFGSRITPSGKQAKACADSRRIVVVPPASIGIQGQDATPIMLRVPQSSTKPLREYVSFLVKNGFLPNACITRMSFDVNEAFPKLNFQFAGPLTDAQFAHAEYLQNDDRTIRILAAPIDGPAAEELDGAEPGTLQTSRPPVNVAQPPEQYAQPAAQPPAQPQPVAQPPQQPVPVQQPPAQPWQPPGQQQAPEPQPISQQAQATGPAFPGAGSAPGAWGAGAAPVNPFGAAPAPQPLPAAQPQQPLPFGQPVGPGTANPIGATYAGPVIDGTVNPEHPPAQSAAPEPKKRTRASSPPAQAQEGAAPAATGAPASLDALLGGLLQK